MTYPQIHLHGGCRISSFSISWHLLIKSISKSEPRVGAGDAYPSGDAASPGETRYLPLHLPRRNRISHFSISRHLLIKKFLKVSLGIYLNEGEGVYVYTEGIYVNVGEGGYVYTEGIYLNEGEPAGAHRWLRVKADTCTQKASI